MHLRRAVDYLIMRSGSTPNTLSRFFVLSDRQFMRHDDWFTRFVVDDFIPSDVDQHLRNTFPNEILTSKPVSQLTASVSYDDQTVAHLLHQSQMWSSYFDAVLSEDFLTDLLKVFRREIQQRYPWYWRWILSPRALNPANLQTTALFSASRQGFQLSPHSDDKHKVISLIHYLPEIGSQGHESGGTRFFTPHNPRSRRRILKPHSNWSRGIRRFIPFLLAPSFEISLTRRLRSEDKVDQDEVASFNLNFGESQSLTYSPNRLTGFIKNSWSVHEVDLSNFPSTEIRRAIIINVRLIPTRATSFLDDIDRILSRFKSMIVGSK